MNYADSKLLVEYSHLELAIARGKNQPIDQRDDIPEADRWLDESERAKLRKLEETTRRDGVRRVRAFVDHLSPKKRAKFMADIRAKVDAARELVSKARAAGEPVDMGDLEFNLREDGEAGGPAGHAAAAHQDGSR